jgi:hypothetical protein
MPSTSYKEAMIIKTLLAAIFVFSLLAAACASSTDGGETTSTRTPAQETSNESDSTALTQDTGSNPQLAELVQVSLETMPPRSGITGTLIRIIVRNTSDDAFLSFSGASDEFVVYDEGGEEVWSPRRGSDFSSIPPGGTKTFQTVWEHKSNECSGHPLYSP